MKVKIENYPKKGKRKIEIQIDNFDVWNLDNTIATLMVPLLKKFRKINISTPMCFFPDEDLTFDEQQTEEAHKKWEEALDKMILGFETILSLGDKEQELFDKYYNLDKNKFIEETAKLQAQIDEGLALFAKHFNRLWL